MKAKKMAAVMANPSTPRLSRQRELLILFLLIAIVSLAVFPYVAFHSIVTQYTHSDTVWDNSAGTIAQQDRIVGKRHGVSSFDMQASWKLATPSDFSQEPSSCEQSESAGKFLSRHETKALIAEIAEAVNTTMRLEPMARVLLKRAEETNSTLLTVQVGGMDGVTGDPMNRMSRSFSSLVNWMPVVFEAVEFNFRNLQSTYKDLQEKKQLRCPLLLHQAVSYDGKTTCPFCHYDTVKEECKNAPNWQKHEIGSLDCGFFELRFKNCYVHDNLSCDTIANSLKKWSLPLDQVAILQIDVEGYEEYLLPGFFSEIEGQPELYPPIINFESKILRSRGRLKKVEALFEAHGYQIHHSRIDSMALLLN